MTDATPTDPNRALAVVRQDTIQFYADSLTGALADDNELYVPLNQLCDCLHLTYSAQVQRIKRTEALKDGLPLIRLTAQDGRQREVLCLRVDLVPGWLATISTRSIANQELRAKIVAFQRELYRVAWAVFGPERAAVMPAGRVESLAREMAVILDRMEAIDQAVSALYDMLGEQSNVTKAISVLVEGLQSELTALRADVGHLEERTAKSFKIASDKLRGIELKLNPGTRIIDEQAARLKEGVNHIATEMRKRGTANPYGQIWGAFNHYFNVPEYRSLPQGKFGEALDWLTRWETDLLEGKEHPTEEDEL